MNPLMAAWILVASHGSPHTVEWRRRGGEVVVLALRLASTLLHVTAHDDQCEHQAQLLLVLHFYHQFVRVRSRIQGRIIIKCLENLYLISFIICLSFPGFRCVAQFLSHAEAHPAANPQAPPHCVGL